jgi:hypothetical protein
MKTRLHDPQAKSIHGLDWTLWLAKRSTTIVTSSWVIPSGITKVSDSNTATSATIIISGGTDKTSYIVTNHIVTASGLEDDRSFILKVKNR